MSFQISQELDANKVFLVRSSELEGRFDPNFYKPYLSIAIHNRGIKVEKLGNIARFSNEIWDQRSFFEIFFPYIEIGEIDLSTGEINKINQILINEAPSRARMIVRKDDILISTTRPSRGAISILESGNILIASTGFSVIRSIVDEIDRRYLFLCLRQDFSLKQMEQRSSGGNYPAITQEELKKIKIPVPPLAIQSAIVAKMDAAYASKRAKEAEAQRLLDSIDAYLLGELGIELPEQEENTIQSRIFTRRFSEISGGRLDPDFHAPYYKHFEEFLYKSKFEIKKLSEMSSRIFQGVGRKLTDNQEYILLKVKNILKNNGIDLSNTEFVDIDDKNKLLKTGDIISPFIGEAIKQYKFSVYSHSGNYTVDNNTGVIRLKRAAADPLFVSAVMMSSIGRWQLRQLTGGGGVPFLGSFNAKKLQIPLPPLPVQTEIADHIAQIRSRAKQLQQEAVEGLELAKREVEAMLLGDSAKTL